MNPIQDRRQKFILSLGGFLLNPLVAFLFVFGICACCKLMALNSRELWLDETYSAMVANFPLGKLLRHTSGDVHPPLFYMLLWGWVRIVGDTQAQLRLFSVALNLCSLPAMYLFARRVLGSRFGAYAAMLYAFSPMLFVYSLEVRMYMLLILVFIFLLIAHWALVVEHREEKRIVVAYSVLAAALFYIHYIAIFILLGLLIHWTTTSKLSRARILRLSATVMLTILFISPGIPILLKQHAGKSEQTLALERSLRDPSALSFGNAPFVEPSGAKVLAKSVAAMAGFFPAASPILLLLCAIPLMVALFGTVLLGIMKGDPLCRLFLLMALALGSGVIALHLSSTRYLLPLIPLLVLAMARVVQYGAGRSRWLIPSIAVGSLIFCVYAAGFIRQATVRHGRPWQNLVGVVEQNYQPGDLIVFDALYSQVPFDYFAQQTHFHPREAGFPISIYSWWEEQKFKGWGGPVISRSDLDRFTSELAGSKTKTVWLVSHETYYYDPYNELEAKLRELGQVTEYPMPTEGNVDAHGNAALRLMRVTIR